jgi:hypothetical protein
MLYNAFLYYYSTDNSFTYINYIPSLSLSFFHLFPFFLFNSFLYYSYLYPFLSTSDHPSSSSVSSSFDAYYDLSFHLYSLFNSLNSFVGYSSIYYSIINYFSFHGYDYLFIYSSLFSFSTLFNYISFYLSDLISSLSFSFIYSIHCSSFPSLLFSSFYMTIFNNYLLLSLFTFIKIYITSFDVIHSFGYHSLGFKSDAIVGRINFISNISLLFYGSFYGYCYELCGLSHSSMLHFIYIL